VTSKDKHCNDSHDKQDSPPSAPRLNREEVGGERSGEERRRIYLLKIDSRDEPNPAHVEILG
jgi:hypothetical protein